MPTIPLSDRKVAALQPLPSRVEYFDRSLPGFGVRVSPEGRKSWVLLYRNGGKRLRRLTLGVYPTIGLATARELAQSALRDATVGKDPAADRQRARQHTFDALTDRYLEKHAKPRKRSWRDDARMIRVELDAWADRPAASITRTEVRELLDGIVDRGAPVAANRVLALIRKIFNFGLDQEWVESNPALRVARPSIEHSRTRVLTTTELGAVWKWLHEPASDDLDGTDRRYFLLNRAALKLRLITAQRGGEVVSMRWSDVDLSAGWWTIPAARSKNKLPHRVPLSGPALKVLAVLKAMQADDAPQVFRGIVGTRQRRGALDGLDLPDVRPHDFRRTAASCMASAGVPRLVISKVLNHVEAGVTAVYDRHGYDIEKENALQAWARILESHPT